MRRRGPKPKQLIDVTWRPSLAYAIGLIATDGCLSSDGLLVDLTSKDMEQLLNFSNCLGRRFAITSKQNSNGDKCLRIQFKSRLFYDFLLSIELTPRKSLTLGPLSIPDEYFFDFLRGSYDGDGCFYSYWDPRWRSSHMFYLEFTSASKRHIDWLRENLQQKIGVTGHMSERKEIGKRAGFIQLKYAKKEALEIIKKMYYSPTVVCLSRKKIKIERALAIEKEQQARYT